MTRVFVTGMGALTPIGNDPVTFWENLLIGKSGAARITQFDVMDIPINIGCEVKDFDPLDYMERKTSRRTTRSTQFGIAAAKQALVDADLVVDERNWNRVGIMMATGGGGITAMEAAAIEVVEKGWRSVGPFVVPSVMANAASCLVSMETGARGPVMTSSAACASGHYSIIEAYHFLKRGEADVMIAGGTESALSQLVMAAFARMGPLSKRNDDPEHASRPFSVDRDGFVSGEGSGALIMETEEHARKRGARIYAEVLGGALTADAFHITAPDPGRRRGRACAGECDSLLGFAAGGFRRDLRPRHRHGAQRYRRGHGAQACLWRACERRTDHEHQEHGRPCHGGGRRPICRRSHLFPA